MTAPSEADAKERGLRRATADAGQLVRYSWRASRGATTAVLLLPLLLALLPFLQTIFNGLLVGAIPPAIQGGSSSPAADRAIQLLVIVAGLILASTAVGQVNGLTTSFLGPRFSLEGRRAVGEAVNRPAGIAHLEDPGLADEVSFVLGRDREWIWQEAISFGQTVFMSWAQGIGYVILLGSFRWWLPLVAVPAWLLDWKNGADYAHGNLYGGQRAASGVRRAAYLKHVAAGPTAAKEVRAFGLADWLVAGLRSQWTLAMQPVWESNRKGLPVMGLAGLAKVLAGLVIFWLLADAAVDGRISLAALAIYAPAGLNVVRLGYFGDANTYFSQATNIAGRAHDIETRVNALESGTGDRPAAGLPQHEIVFESVSFSYPGSDHLVLDDLDLTIRQGKSLAVVGDNGAGKTTLIKLLCRLYEPTSGRILVDGIPLAELDLASWRARVGVIFQDFVRWELPLKDNVLFGARDPEQRELLEHSLQDAGAEDLLEDLPEKWSTILSRGFEGGTELSGGQWQKVALARALAAVRRGAEVLVLDEPTASLDVRAEVAVFERLLDATRGVTTILVSHRFNTVRRADRIVVISGGQAVEEGSHEELIGTAGRYASMYRMQADRFDDPAGDPAALEETLDA